MITRIEIDGFKSFSTFAVDLEPFTVIAGANASGKSNLFDALRLLSRLAEYDVHRALEELRGEPDELFRWSGGELCEQMQFAVEVLLDRHVEDDFGQRHELTHTRVRYELVLMARTDEHGITRVFVDEESATPILLDADPWIVSRELQDHPAVVYSRHVPWITTDGPRGLKTFELANDGGEGRRTIDVEGTLRLTREAVAKAKTTILSTVTTATHPHMYALREELRSWRLLQLDPAGLRRSSAMGESDVLEPDGSNLARVLERIRASTQDDSHPVGALADISADLAAIVPGVRQVSVRVSSHIPREIGLSVEFRGEATFSARVLSDGTLRVLALLTLLHDPEHHGVVLFEEPENGVHPGHVRELVARLDELTTDFEHETLEADRLRQLIVNTHSPVVVAAIKAHQLVFADVFTRIAAGGEAEPAAERVTRMRRAASDVDRVEPVTGSIEEPPRLTRWEIQRYLATVRPEG